MLTRTFDNHLSAMLSSGRTLQVCLPVSKLEEMKLLLKFAERSLYLIIN